MCEGTHSPLYIVCYTARVRRAQTRAPSMDALRFLIALLPTNQPTNQPRLYIPTFANLKMKKNIYILFRSVSLSLYFFSLSPSSSGVNTFSPEGRLFQVEYAIEAIKLGSTALGIQTKEGVLLAVEKRITSSLMEPSSIEKIVEVDAHIGCAMSGLTADARTMIDKARVEAQNYWFTYNEPMPTESVTQSVCNLAMQFGETVRLCFLSFILSFFFERCASSFVQKTL